jgi:hypothetical protein
MPGQHKRRIVKKIKKIGAISKKRMVAAKNIKLTTEISSVLISKIPSQIPVKAATKAKTKISVKNKEKSKVNKKKNKTKISIYQYDHYALRNAIANDNLNETKLILNSNPYNTKNKDIIYNSALLRDTIEYIGSNNIINEINNHFQTALKSHFIDL